MKINEITTMELDKDGHICIKQYSDELRDIKKEYTKKEIDEHFLDDHILIVSESVEKFKRVFDKLYNKIKGEN
jgi:DNA recombination-dependent growth factor C